jgi:hypothetical protein
MPGARCTRSLESEKGRRCSPALFTTSRPESPSIPRTMVYGLLRDLPGVPGFLATVAGVSADLDTSVGVSGPHDFAVRDPSAPKASPGWMPVRRSFGEGEKRALVSRRPTSIASHPASVTFAKHPSVGWDTSDIGVICSSVNQNIFAGRA